MKHYLICPNCGIREEVHAWRESLEYFEHRAVEEVIIRQGENVIARWKTSGDPGPWCCKACGKVAAEEVFS